MARWPKPPEGSWTEHYPELGTHEIDYEDSIDPEFYRLEQKAIFERTWLNVGRVEQLPRTGSYFTKELAVVNTSIVVVRDRGGDIHAFHNICRHRGNKLVWNDMPNEESSGSCRQFICKYHGWRYGLDGALNVVQQEDQFFDVEKETHGLLPVHLDVWAGFIFVNVAETPEENLRDFLGPKVTQLEGYPFDKLTERFTYRSEVKANWKLYMDAFAEFYHAPVLHGNQTPERYSTMAAQAGFEAPHYELMGPHRMVSTSGIKQWELANDMRKPMEDITRSGLTGPWDVPDIGAVSGLNPGKCDPWGLDSWQLWPNFVILIWKDGWYLTYHYWPTSYNTHIFEGNLYFVPSASARERVAHEMAALTFKEYGLQDSNTLEATQTMLQTRRVTRFPLNDQEILLRHLHKTAQDRVSQYQKGTADASL